MSDPTCTVLKKAVIWTSGSLWTKNKIFFSQLSKRNKLSTIHNDKKIMFWLRLWLSVRYEKDPLYDDDCVFFESCLRFLITRLIRSRRTINSSSESNHFQWRWCFYDVKFKTNRTLSFFELVFFLFHKYTVDRYAVWLRSIPESGMWFWYLMYMFKHQTWHRRSVIRSKSSL